LHRDQLVGGGLRPLTYTGSMNYPWSQTRAWRWAGASVPLTVAIYVAWATVWVCSCLFMFVATLNWPHQCQIVNCQHKGLQNRKHK